MPKKKSTGKSLSKSSKIKKEEMPVLDYEETVPAEESPKPKARLPVLTILVLVVVFFLLGSFIYRNKQYFVVGFINGRPVTSIELYNKMVSQYGKQSLDQIVIEKLVADEANNKKLTISQKEIDDEVKKIEDSLGQTTTLTDALAQQGMTLKNLQEQIKLRLIANKLIADKVNVTDEEVNKYYTENKDALPKDQNETQQKESIKTFLKDQKASEQIQTLIQELKTKAKTNSYL